MPHSNKPFVVESVIQYEEVVGVIETILQRLLEDTFYDTVHNFLDFFESYRESGCKQLQNFFQIFNPPVDRRHHTCVSLAMEIIARISDIYPDIADSMYLVSCEEAVESCSAYVEACEDSGIDRATFGVEKEHCLVALKVIVGDRKGVMVLDPGYHVARAVTIMKDKDYPHTGWFVQTEDQISKREYCYEFNRNSMEYVEWRERTVRNGVTKCEESLIFVDRPYMTAVDVTIKRNLVYNFRSLLSRDAKGQVKAGFYFPLLRSSAEAFVTLFYSTTNNYNNNSGGNNGGANTNGSSNGSTNPDEIIKNKYMWSVFGDVSRLSPSLKHTIQVVANQLHMEYNELLLLLKKCADAVTDTDYMEQVLLINTEISEMSINN